MSQYCRRCNAPMNKDRKGYEQLCSRCLSHKEGIEFIKDLKREHCGNPNHGKEPHLHRADCLPIGLRNEKELQKPIIKPGELSDEAKEAVRTKFMQDKINEVMENHIRKWHLKD